MLKVKGIHHISAIVTHPQENVDFNAGILGLMPIVKTVNFDDGLTYHLYYGNNKGALGSLMTYFAWDTKLNQGLIGDGQVGIISYAIPVGSLDFWKKRLSNFNVKYQITPASDNKEILSFQDTVGLEYQLIETEDNIINDYSFNGISSKDAIKGFYSATLYSKKPEQTATFLTDFLGMELISRNKKIASFKMDAKIGSLVDLALEAQGIGKMGTGTVHHIAFIVADSQMELWHKKLSDSGIYATAIKDRDFFRSIYFKEPGGIIIELASDKPGFSFDVIDNKFEKLYLPQQYKQNYDNLVTELIPIFVREIDRIGQYNYHSYQGYLNWVKHNSLLEQINNLAKMAKIRELTSEEIQLRASLRVEYIKGLIGNVKGLVENIKEDKNNGGLKS